MHEVLYCRYCTLTVQRVEGGGIAIDLWSRKKVAFCAPRTALWRDSDAFVMSRGKEKAPLPSLGGTLGFGDITESYNHDMSIRLKEEPFCVLCNRHFVSRELFDSHLDGFTHKTSMQKLCKGGLGGCGALLDHITKTLEPVQPRIHDE